MKLFLLFIVFFLIGLAIVLSNHYWNSQILPSGFSIPSVTTKFSLKNAPSESLRGTIASMSGDVNWLSRTDAKSTQLKTKQTVQQGEEVSTGNNGKAVINIKNTAVLAIQPNSHISIIQLLPQNFVFVQDKGTVDYGNAVKYPTTVRSFDLVSLIIHGSVRISVDSTNQTVTVHVEEGAVKEGYEDLQNNSNVVSVNPGQTFIFDETNKVGSIQ